MVLVLQNKTRVDLSLAAIDPTTHSLRLKVTLVQDNRSLRTDYSIRNAGTVFVSAGPDPSGDVLVLAIIPTLK